MTDAEMQQLLEEYTPSRAAIESVRSAQIVLLVGITGAGKNTLKNELLKDSAYADFISHTTRAPRSNHGVMEQDGIDYHFIELAAAARMLRDGDYIEAKKVHANIYGTTTRGLKIATHDGRIAVNDVDVQGVDEYKSISPSVHAVFVLPPSFAVWNERRLARHSNVLDPEDDRVRLESAREEIAFALEKGYYDFVVNDDIHLAVAEIRQIVEGTRQQPDNQRATQTARQLLIDLGTH